MRPKAVLAAAAIALAASAPTRADEAKTKAAARALLAKYGNAVITVKLTVKSRMVFQGRERNSTESSLEVAGTLLTPSGLTVVSDFTTDPAALYQGDGDGPQVDTETTDVKLVLRDAREIPARFVLRDRDLDLAFIAPVEKGLALPSVNFEKRDSPGLLDDLIFLYPLGKSLNREMGVATAQVRAVVRKPRTFIVTDLLDGLQRLGCPAFDESGHAVGLVVLRRAPAPPTGLNGFRSMLDTFNPVVLTAADLQEVAAQAAAAKEASK